ncbi:unnamed protein product [Boreogadus saida]
MEKDAVYYRQPHLRSSDLGSSPGLGIEHMSPEQKVTLSLALYHLRHRDTSKELVIELLPSVLETCVRFLPRQVLWE